MTDNRNLNPDEERIDAVDHIIFKELGEQARLKQKMQEWEERKRKQLRLRLLPVVSNIASVAALFVMGVFLQAMLPKTNLSTDISQTADSTLVAPPSVETDSLNIAE
jgi:ABC-type Fe3+-siderophore transport system permease subunit